MSKSRVTQNSSDIIATIFKARVNVLAQLEARGYNIDDYSGCSVNEINSMHQSNQLDMMMPKEKPDESGVKTQIYIKFFAGSKKFGPSNAQEIVDDLFVFDEVLKKEDTLVIVIKDDPNETTINYQKHIWEQDKIFVSIVSIQRLQFNILKHEFVPPHRVMSSSEVASVKKKFNVMGDDQFPEISRFDPVAVAIGIRPGQLCEILRPSKTAVWSKYYRICI